MGMEEGFVKMGCCWNRMGQRVVCVYVPASGVCL